MHLVLGNFNALDQTGLYGNQTHQAYSPVTMVHYSQCLLRHLHLQTEKKLFLYENDSSSNKTPSYCCAAVIFNSL